MKRFFNQNMEKQQNISEEDAANLREAFKTAGWLIHSLLGSKHAFKRYYRGDAANSNGHWEPTKFNFSLYDVLMGVLWEKDKNQAMAALDPLREGWIDLLTNNAGFIEAIERSTSSEEMVRRRFDIARQGIEGTLQEHWQPPRCFSRALKQSLFDAAPTCAICQQAINEVDDAAVDHIEQYWRGEKTIPENARLAHRYCNSERSKHDGGNILRCEVLDKIFHGELNVWRGDLVRRRVIGQCAVCSRKFGHQRSDSANNTLLWTNLPRLAPNERSGMPALGEASPDSHEAEHAQQINGGRHAARSVTADCWRVA